MTPLEHALDMADRGFLVFPLKGKEPLVKKWQNRATTDEPTIRGWFARWPDANYGVATGNGLVVLDLDLKNGHDGAREVDRIRDGAAAFEVETPSGGRHEYWLAATPLRNRVGVLPGVDVRADGGFVVGPGSVLDGKPYRLVAGSRPRPAPDWLVELAGRRIERKESAVPDTREWDDNPAALATARRWLELDAPVAVEGAGGDHTTFIVAAKLREYGLTKTTALSLLLEDWNERCSPPWDAEALATKIDNAWAYAQNAPHSADPAMDFADDPAVTVAPPAPNGLKLAWLDETDLNDTPPERWVLGDFLARGRVSALLGAGGVGKSVWTIGAAASIATGQPLVGMEVHEPGKVLLINGEDPDSMMRNRINAWVLGCSLDRKDIAKGRLGWLAFEQQSFKLVARGEDNTLRKTQAFSWLARFIRSEGVVAVIIDPWVEAHDAEENSNTEVSRVATLVRALAFETKCAAMIVHHTRKGAVDPGDMDAGRGASALSGVCRTMATYVGMGEDEASQFGVLPQHAWRYSRLDMAKNNLAPLRRDPIWYEKIQWPLPNGMESPFLRLAELRRPEVSIGAVIVEECSALLEGGPVPLSEVAQLVAENPAFAADGVGKIKTRIKRDLAAGVSAGGWVLGLEKIGKTDHVVGWVQDQAPPA